MPKKEIVYKFLITDDDRVTTRFIQKASKVIEFSVIYHARIDKRWKKVTAFDNAHDSLPHRHVYSPHKPEYKHLMNTKNPNKALTEAQSFIKKEFIKMRESYIISMRNVGGGES
jgi:hypothetical protein